MSLKAENSEQISSDQIFHGPEPGPLVLRELEVRAVEPDEMERVRELLGEEHYLGAGRDVATRWCRWFIITDDGRLFWYGGLPP